ncbi:MAG: hypothetical protein EPO26_13270 [Chloroflexota bacterium]|nr:MAG: hypothetical protein EPO26_13270 [Chloroflexota bacterium]
MSDRPPPVDQPARDRLRRDFDSTLFVEAGAGTGKTTALVGRIVAMVADGRLEMERLAAITFTELAAAELRGRIRRDVFAESLNNPSVEAQERCRRAAAEVDLASIGTIHSFCGALLRSYPIEARLPPTFRVLDDIQTRVHVEERVRELFDQIGAEPLDGPRITVLRRAMRMGLELENLADLARILGDSLDALSDASRERPTRVDAVAVAHEVGADLRALEDEIRYCKVGVDDLVGAIQRCQGYARRLSAVRDESIAVELLDRYYVKNATRGQKGNWSSRPDGRNACDVVKETFKSKKDACEQAVKDLRANAMIDVLEMLRPWLLDEAERRRRDGTATFGDLLLWARDLVRDSAEVRQQARHHWDRVFVDEFQDTDPLQAELLWRLCASEDTDGPWEQASLTPGKMFLVGDPKQSIYRFRRADIALFDRLYRAAGDDERVELTQNFRSLPEVLRWVNAHHGALMTEIEGVQPAYAPLRPLDLAHPEGPCGVSTIGDEIDANAGARRDVEAAAIAHVVRTAIDEGWPVRDGAITRPAELDDVCVLLPTRALLRALEDAFEREGLPLRVEGGALLLETQEVRDLLNCLQAIDNPTDQVALVAALRSPAYACTDPDLLAWHEAGGTLDYLAEQSADVPSVATAFASLRAFHEARLTRSAAATIDVFVHDRMLAIAAFDRPRPRDALRRFRYVINQARSLASAGRESLRAVITWFDGLATATTREPDAPTPELDDRAVRVMTVHAAKGLEFPIVVAAGLDQRPPSQRASAAVIVGRDAADASLDVMCGKLKTPGWEAAAEHEKKMDEAQRLRLLYVATTRARDHLILSLTRRQHKKSKGGHDKTHAEQIVQLLDAGDPTLTRALDRPGDGGSWQRPTRAQPPPLSPMSPEEDADRERAWIAERADLASRLARVRRVTPTALDTSENGRTSASGLPEPEMIIDEAQERPVPDVAPVGQAVAVAIGAAVHDVLEAVDPGGATLDALVDAAAERRGIPDHREDVRDLVTGARMMVSQRQPRNQWREVPFALSLDGTLIEGRIDLVIEDDGGRLIVIDFKTDRVAPMEVRDHARRYRPQVGLYALAVEDMIGRPIHEVRLLFPAPRQAVTFPDVPALIEEARAAIAAIPG